VSYYHNSSCDTAMTKPSHYSYEQWESKKYCSRKCGARSPLHQNFTVGHKHSQETIDKIKKARNKRV